MQLVILGRGGKSTTLVVQPGERVLDVCDESDAPIAFSCRTANCGVCRVNVLEGAQALAPPGDEEVGVLRAAGAGPSERLACQLVCAAESGRVVLEAIVEK